MQNVSLVVKECGYFFMFHFQVLKLKSLEIKVQSRLLI